MNQFRKPKSGAVTTNNSVHLSTVANSKFGNTPWLNIESAGWLNIQPALTRQLIEGAAQAFNGASTQPEVDLIPLQAKIGQLTLENDFLERALTKAGLLSAKR